MLINNPTREGSTRDRTRIRIPKNRVLPALLESSQSASLARLSIIQLEFSRDCALRVLHRINSTCVYRADRSATFKTFDETVDRARAAHGYFPGATAHAPLRAHARSPVRACARPRESRGCEKKGRQFLSRKKDWSDRTRVAL